MVRASAVPAFFNLAITLIKRLFKHVFFKNIVIATLKILLYKMVFYTI